MMLRSLGLWSVLMAVACAPSGGAAVGSPPSPEPQQDAVEEAVVTPAEPAERPSPLVIGIRRPTTVTAAARKANRAGLVLHRAADYEGSRTEFARAVAAQPEHDMARFNLACALGRLGRHAEAANELIEVLTRDPVRFRDRVRADADLESLRAAPEWEAVEDVLARAEVALDHAFAHGVPSMFYEHSRPWASSSAPQEGGTQHLVAGLYLHELERFVPLVRGGAAAAVDVERRRVLKVESVVWEGVVHSMWRSSKLSLTSFAPDDPLAVTVDLEKDGPRAVGKPKLMQEGDGSGFELSMIMVRADAGLWLDLEWHTQVGDPYKKRTKLELTAAGLVRATGPIPETGARIEFMYEGTVVYDPLPVGHRVDGRTYRAPERAPVQLGAGHQRARWQSVLLTPDGRFAIVTSIEHRQGPRFDEVGFGILRHAVDRVSLSTGEVKALAAGRGTARSVLGPDGALYIQGGDQVQRWPTPDAEQPEPVTKGLKLVPALDAFECGLCG